MYTAYFLFSNNVNDMEGNLFQLLDLKLTVDGLEKERDFYFGKLRDIEVMCQENDNEQNPIIQKILDILYATEVSLLWK
jgi:Microtubule-binding protein involved in cell cycle control